MTRLAFDRTRFAADPMTVRAALLRLQDGCVLASLSADHRDCVLLVLAEVLNNVAEHAYGGAVGPVAVSLRSAGGRVAARVIDKGGVAPALGASAAPVPADFAEGGFGTGLILSLASAIDQRRRMGCNVLRFRINADNEETLD